MKDGQPRQGSLLAWAQSGYRVEWVADHACGVVLFVSFTGAVSVKWDDGSIGCYTAAEFAAHTRLEQVTMKRART